ncbi:MAG: hypothetical protein M3Q46_14925, partial [Verrucomicrobiota bacterium]|nr:hypothetical protein [Verrucomicrobiota bacterium]
MSRLFALSVFCLLGGAALAEVPESLQNAIAPLTDGVPQVAIERLTKFLAQKPAPAEQAMAKRKLLEALVRAERPAEALEVFALDDLASDPETTFWQAQAFAALDRWASALPLYQRLAADKRSPRRAEAAFGEAEALRALGQKERALEVLTSLENVPAWRTRAKLGRAQLLIERGTLPTADRLLRETKPKLPTERSERRFLLGRLSLVQGHTARAIETLGVLLKDPEGVSLRLLVATLFALTEAHLAALTPEVGDDALEE